jgi:diaminopimelate epimerase
MLLRFTKMHGLGNDFMVLDLISQHAHILPKHAKQWGDRHTGIGFDQLLLVETPSNPDVDFRYRIFNADGSEVEQCGNGARCFARFVLDKRLTAKRQIRVETKSGIIELDIRSDGQISVNMGPPRLIPEQIPFQADKQALSYAVEVDGQIIELAAVSMGNPHAVLRVEDINNAAAVAAIIQGWMDSPLLIDLPGGRLSIEWEGPGHPVMMTGPAVRVYEGQVRL